MQSRFVAVRGSRFSLSATLHRIVGSTTLFLMMDFFFDVPWWIPAVLLLGGGIAFVAGNNRRKTVIRMMGLMVVLLGVALALASYLVDTPVERAEKDSRRFVATFVARDWDAFASFLDRKVSLSAQGIPLALYANRDELISAAKQAQAQYDFTSISVLSAKGQRIDGVIPVIVTLLSEQQATLGRPFPSTWEFEWQDFGEGYKLIRITAILIANEAPNRLKGNFPRN